MLPHILSCDVDTVTPSPPSRPRWTRYAAPLMIAMNIVWGASYIVADIGLRQMGPMNLAAWRFLLASALLFPLMVFTRTPYRLERRDVPLVMAIGIFAVSANYVLTYLGIQYASATDPAVVRPLEPVVLAILAVIFLREKLTRVEWLGIVVACVGTYLLVARHVLAGAGWDRVVLLGQSLILLGIVAEGMYSIIGKPLLRRYRPLALTSWAMAFGCICLFGLTAVFEGTPRPPASATAWGSVIFLAVPCTVIGYTLWYILLEHMKAGVLGAYIFIQPVVGVALGIAYQGERLSVGLVVGIILVMMGVSLTGGAGPAEDIPDPEPSA
jgi:drug/metabolite transporter (DMT)-like permease